VIDDESLVKTRTNTCLSETSGIPSYSVAKVTYFPEGCMYSLIIKQGCIGAHYHLNIYI
jgi:hypothetical protein